MTVETRERSGMRRIVFYTLRALVLYCAVYGLWTDRGFYALLLGIALIVFWRVKKRMPYDYVRPSCGAAASPARKNATRRACAMADALYIFNSLPTKVENMRHSLVGKAQPCQG